MNQLDGWPKVSHFLDNGVWILPQPANDAIAEFYDSILTVPVGDLEETDSIVWLGTSTGSSFVSAWNRVRVHRAQWPWARLLWHKVIPKSYSILGWRVFWRRLSTLDQVQHYHPEIDLTCRLCERHAETLDHLFLSCTFTRDLWQHCCSALNLAFDPMDMSLEGIVTRLPQLLRKSRGGVLARLTLLTWIFTVWEERNARIFDLKCRSSNQVVNSIACRVRDIWNVHSHMHDEISERVLAWRVSASSVVYEPP